MPPTTSRANAVDLLLCGHHFRASQAALTGAGAHIFDASGALIWAPGMIVQSS